MNASLPVLSVLFAVLATGVPWGLPADATFILPLVVVMMVFCWRVLPGAHLQPYVAALLGLLADVMSGGPLGFWALMALTGAIAGGLTPALGDGQDMKRLWLAWAAVAVLVAGLSWLIASLYFLRWIDAWPIAFGALASVALFPVVLHGLLWIKRGRLTPGRRIIVGRWT
jgi:rod shape-determining protein MreD